MDHLWQGLDKAGDVLEHIGLPVADVADFVTDVMVNTHNLNSHQENIKLMGKLGFYSLGVSCAVNAILLWHHVHMYTAFYSKMFQKRSAVLKLCCYLFMLIGLTNVEATSLLFVFWKRVLRRMLSTDQLQKGDENDIAMARMHLKRLALFSQLVENCPELVIQLLAIVFHVKENVAVHRLSLISVATTAWMLVYKILTNILANVIGVDATQDQLERVLNGRNQTALFGNVTMRLFKCKRGVDWLQCSYNLAATVLTFIFFARVMADAGFGSHSFILTTIYMCIICGLLTILNFTILAHFIWTRRDECWFLCTQNIAATCVCMLATFSPGMVGAIQPSFAGLIYLHVAGYVPILRSVVSVFLLAVPLLPSTLRIQHIATAIDGSMFNTSSTLCNGTVFQHWRSPPHMVRSMAIEIGSSEYVHLLILVHIIAIALSCWASWCGCSTSWKGCRRICLQRKDCQYPNSSQTHQLLPEEQDEEIIVGPAEDAVAGIREIRNDIQENIGRVMQTCARGGVVSDEDLEKALKQACDYLLDEDPRRVSMKELMERRGTANTKKEEALNTKGAKALRAAIGRIDKKCGIDFTSLEEKLEERELDEERRTAKRCCTVL